MENRKRVRWSVEETRLIRRYYPGKGAAFCAELLQSLGHHRTISACDNRAYVLNLSYTGPPLGRFKKGNTPANKGQKMSAETYKKSKKTMFKKGHTAHNCVPVGAESIRDGYTYVKTAPRKWVQKHRLLYIKRHGAIPPDSIITFKDGNPNNFSPDNLEAIPRKALAYRNCHGDGPKEYSLITGRAAKNRLKKAGIDAKTIRENPDLLKLSEALLITKQKIRIRKRHVTQG